MVCDLSPPSCMYGWDVGWRSNGDCNDPRSLHFINPYSNAGMDNNAYVQAILAVGTTLEYYDADKVRVNCSNQHCSNSWSLHMWMALSEGGDRAQSPEVADCLAVIGRVSRCMGSVAESATTCLIASH